MGIRKKWYESNIELYEKRIPELETLLTRLKRGDKIRHATIGGVFGTHILYPKAKYVRVDLKEMKERLAENRRLLKKVM